MFDEFKLCQDLLRVHLSIIICRWECSAESNVESYSMIQSTEGNFGSKTALIVAWGYKLKEPIKIIRPGRGGWPIQMLCVRKLQWSKKRRLQTKSWNIFFQHNNFTCLTSSSDVILVCAYSQLSQTSRQTLISNVVCPSTYGVITVPVPWF